MKTIAFIKLSIDPIIWSNFLKLLTFSLIVLSDIFTHFSATGLPYLISGTIQVSAAQIYITVSLLHSVNTPV